MLRQAVVRDPKLQEKEDRTGIPPRMKEKCEAVSGLSFDDVRIHYSSGKPGKLGALAYTQGNHVYVGPGQERCLGHELGHVVQQKQGRVKPDTFFRGHAVNTDRTLESEADRLGGTIQCATSINYFGQTYAYPIYSEQTDPVTGQMKYVYSGTTETETVGGTTIAHLDPTDPQTGSTPSGQDQMMDNLRMRYGLVGSQLVRGHLLNHDLGGEGVEDNMFPITGEANRMHSHNAEQQIKSMLYKGHEVDYTITAVNNNARLGVGSESKCVNDEFRVDVTAGGQTQSVTVYSNMYRKTGSASGQIEDNLPALYDKSKIGQTRAAWRH